MTFIIAECGSNWLTLQDCHDSIKSAKNCGADAVKFQMYTHKELYGYEELYSYDEYIQQAIDPDIYQGPKKLAGELPREWIPQLAEACKHYGIEFMCTAFSPDGYRYIDPYVKRHKIASAENTDKDILETVKSLGKPVLVSTGGCDFDNEIMGLCDFFENLELCLMYCVSSYPSRNIDLRAIGHIITFTGAAAGYSCHTDEWITPVIAKHMHVGDGDGLVCIEKHFKVRPMFTPDSDHSILPDDFKKMVFAVRGADDLNEGGNPEQPHPDEADFVKYTKRRFIPELNGYYRTKKPT